jgi:hypothetical protein
VEESGQRVLAFKKKWSKQLTRRSRGIAPTTARVEKLTRQLWEFGEEIRFGALSRANHQKKGRRG